jgi:hypothetical protein
MKDLHLLQLLVPLILAVVSQAHALDLVRGGKPIATIVTPDEPLPVVTAAAQELQHHVRRAGGAELPIVKESRRPAGRGLVFLGPCAETQKLGFKLADLKPNGFFVRNAGGNLYLMGDDSAGEPFWIQHSNRMRVGTLFAVYELLEQHMGVRWLWPGPLGEVIPRRATISVAIADQMSTPRFVHTRWRDGGFAGAKGWADQKNRSLFLNEQGKWLRRHRFAMGLNMDMAHSYTDWWDRFAQTHPEYFNLLPDGTRRSDPLYHGGAKSLIAMCVGEPGVARQKVADWNAKRSPAAPHVDASENDTPGKCVCPLCLALDEPDPESKVPFDQRVAEARKRFEAGESDWWLALGSLSDRYARFYLAIQREAQRVDPQAVVMGYAYANYVKPPRNTKLNDHIIIGIVPALMFPWTAEKRQAFIEQWNGWSAAGAQLFLRPNYMLDGHGLPVNFARPLGEDFSFAAHHGLIGTDFDSLTGQYAAQGPNLYMLARLHDAPDLKPEAVLAEYYTAFGQAAPAVKAYWEHWARISAAITDEQAEAAKLHFSYFYREADRFFTPEVMARGRTLLEAARAAARGDAEAEARVAFVKNGLRNAELILATQRAFRQYGQTGDYREFAAALQELDDFRAVVEGECVANMAFLAWAENYTWDRSLIQLMTQPGTRLADPWRFQWDPDKQGEAQRWFAPEHDVSGWLSIGTTLAWEQQEVGRKWQEAHGGDYDGIAWYRTSFTVPATAQGKQVRLLFGAVDEACTIWVNGEKLLERPYPYQGDADSWKTPFEVDLAGRVAFDKPNVVAVRVEDNMGAGGIWRPVWLIVSDAPAESARNLIPDGGFEQTPTPWKQHVQCGKFRFGVDTTVKRSGQSSGTVECLELGPPEAEKTMRTRAWARYYTSVKADPARTYRFRAWIRTSEDFTGTVHLWVTGTKAGTMSVKGLNTQGLWRELTIPDIHPAGAEPGIYLNVMDNTGTVWFDDVELTEAG